MKRLKKILLVGLGNVGELYIGTRHNIGFDALDFWLKRQEALCEEATLGFYANLRFRGVNVHCIKPTTYMNLSGKAVKYWMKKKDIQLDEVLIIVDDIAFPLGVVKLRLKGSDGGHNGLRSIQEALGTQHYARLRCGVGNDFLWGRQSDFVLGKWEADEQEYVHSMIMKVSNSIDEIIKSNFTFAMNVINFRE